MPLKAPILPLLFALTPLLGAALGIHGLTLLVSAVALPLAEWCWGRGRRWELHWGRIWPRVILLIVMAQAPLILILFPPQGAAQAVLIGLACGYAAGGAGIVLAHELGHRRSALDRGLARLMLSTLGWGHYLIEHNRGHHRRAATREDPATARREEHLWRFLPRYIKGIWTEGVKLSRAQPGRLNEAWALAGLTVALWSLVTWAAGSLGLLLIATQAALAVLLVGAVDYMEHWGLVRTPDAQGRPQRLGAAHVWDCHNAVSDALLFNLPRHAHHHMQPWHEADTLQHTPESPQMPTGYAGMVMLTLVPPLWRRVMTPRLPAARGTLP